MLVSQEHYQNHQTHDNKMFFESNLTENGLTVEFYQLFWHDKKNMYIQTILKKKSSLCLTKFENFPTPSTLYKNDALKIPRS